MLINLNRRQLNRKSHIKKYNKIRKLHSEIANNMIEYFEDGKYDFDKYFDQILPELQKETNNLEFRLEMGDTDDNSILGELMMYKNHKDIPSITEIYIEKKKFRNEEKVKMLNSMKNSYVGLFKIIKTDSDNGYVTYQDVFTNKKYKIIDIAMSSTLTIDKNNMIYMYNRIITYDNISFATGIYCMMDSSNKELKKFIKEHNYNKCSDFSRCLLLYILSKKENRLTVGYNNHYGYR